MPDQFDWALQGPDGSVWEIQNQETSGWAGKEQYVYTPSGEVTILTYNHANVEWTFTIVSHLDWRNFWHGGRAGLDQAIKADKNPTNNADYLNTYDGTLLLSSDMVYDTYSQAPLQQDKYAFFRLGPGGGRRQSGRSRGRTSGPGNVGYPTRLGPAAAVERADPPQRCICHSSFFLPPVSHDQPSTINSHPL
ncbi:MAG: hypothetical protein ABSH20_16745 [Tepidisphaeraceae bacterium]|jgi:hypothetical protein